MAVNQTLLAEVTSRLKPRVELPDMTFGFMIDDTASYVIVIAEGQPKIEAVNFLPANRSCTIYMTGATLSDLINGRVDPMVAFFTRQIRVAGPVSEARKLSRLFL